MAMTKYTVTLVNGAEQDIEAQNFVPDAQVLQFHDDKGQIIAAFAGWTSVVVKPAAPPAPAEV